MHFLKVAAGIYAAQMTADTVLPKIVPASAGQGTVQVALVLYLALGAWAGVKFIPSFS